MRRLLLLPVLLLLSLAPLAAAQDWARTKLEASPRHREYVPITHGGRTVQTFIVYPEIKEKAPVVVLIHEIFGLSDWAKEMADELAQQGYIVLAPDLLTGSGPKGGGTDSLGGQDAVTKAVSALPADQVTADLDAVSDFGRKLPAANGKLFVAGFCWGGGQTFAFATHRHDLAAAFVFYGPGPANVSGITTTVFGFYAGNDARIGATLPATTEAMKAAGKHFDPVTYEGAGHGFMRAGEAPDATPANRAARDNAFARLLGMMRTSAASLSATPRSDAPQVAAAEISCHEAGSTIAER